MKINVQITVDANGHPETHTIAATSWIEFRVKLGQLVDRIIPQGAPSTHHAPSAPKSPRGG